MKQQKEGQAPKRPWKDFTVSKHILRGIHIVPTPQSWHDATGSSVGFRTQSTRISSKRILAIELPIPVDVMCL